MAMSKRETHILYTTVTIICVAVLWTYGIGPLYDDYQSTTELLTTEQTAFKKNTDILSRAASIEREYKAIEAQFPKHNPDQRPEHAFNEDVTNQVQNVMGARPRDLSPVVREKMKDVPGYDFLSLNLKVLGELPKLSDLLKSFEQKGFLIQNLSVTQGRLDDPQLTLDLTLARIVKQEEEEERRPGGRRPAGSISLGNRG